ncbi:glycosyltransferase family A protein [Pengzhenrongella sicca]|uniref:Glycosyltransferase family 2 protein n=1 Tax=Pengzhenrongella sicca TaxID=2819238 RepID=A0A8A4ZJ67_9MICO|nr:glycosyltransferase family A protein [Pengzhenrongella sicca]QTE29648.1 glycosyltransferase family 2 protein [Pengzhenrongella sicca]
MTATQARVVIVVPVYNKSAVLERALSSVQRQTYGSWRLVVVDDGSLDDSRDRVRPFLADERVELICQENQGPGAARNRGVAGAAEELVAFLDADDEWEPEFLAALVGALEAQPLAAAAASGWVRIEAGVGTAIPSPSSVRGRWRWDGSVDGPTFKRVVDALHSSATVIRRSEFDRRGGYYEHHCTFGEDSFLWARVALSDELAFVDRALVRFHTDASSLSAGRGSAYPAPPLLTSPGAFLGEAAGARADFAARYLVWYYRFVLLRMLNQRAVGAALRLTLALALALRGRRPGSASVVVAALRVGERYLTMRTPALRRVGAGRDR